MITVTVVVASGGALSPTPSFALNVMIRSVGVRTRVGVVVGHRAQQRLELGDRPAARRGDRQHALAGIR